MRYAVLMAALAFAACGGATQKTAELVPTSQSLVEPTQYGSVYYFATTGEPYYRSLDLFLDAHPGLHCTYAGAIEEIHYPRAANAYTNIVGHAVMCHERAVDAQSLTVP